MGESIAKAVGAVFFWLNRRIAIILATVILVQALVFVLLFAVAGAQTVAQWIPELLLASLFVLLGGALILTVSSRARDKTIGDLNLLVGQELRELRLANDRAISLQTMASTLSATLSFERVVEQSLDVCSLALEEMGIPRESLVGAVFLYEDDVLRPIARRRFLGRDQDVSIPGERGVVGTAFEKAEPVVTNNPQADPELHVYAAFRDSLTAVCVPLRAGFQVFGAMVIGTDTPVQFDKEHIDLFKAVGDQAVIALQNAQLYQRLEAEKHRLIEADEEARKELARDLHDGPTQTIAAIAMRLSFVRSMVEQDPVRAKEELRKIEELTKRTSSDVRGMLFTLRPLVLETQGLGPAIDTLLKRYSETDGVEMRLIGGDSGQLLTKSAQSVVFSIIEEALNNARKYAHAQRIDVRLWRANNLFVASVHDDGVGFDTYDVSRDYSTRGSLGMVNMRERAERIDGSLRVESSPDEGTTVMLVVPLDKHGREFEENGTVVEQSETVEASAG